MSRAAVYEASYYTLGFNPAPSVTCDMPFRLENSDKGNFGCDTVEISAPKSRFGPFFTHILALFVKFGWTLSLKWSKSLENRPKAQF
jgi:hypothetical protein